MVGPGSSFAADNNNNNNNINSSVTKHAGGVGQAVGLGGVVVGILPGLLIRGYLLESERVLFGKALLLRQLLPAVLFLEAPGLKT